MFTASVPFAAFDYLRVPYDVRPDPAEGGGQAPTGLGWLRAGDGPPLLWPVAGGPLLPSPAPRPFTLGGTPLAGTVLCGTASELPAEVRATGRRWRPAEPIHDADGRQIAAVWRDDEGAVFVPFDPGDVMTTLWAERYTDRALGTARGRAKALALRGYYGVRPLLPRQVQLRMRRAFAGVQARTTFPRWPLEPGLHELYQWLLAQAAGIAGRPVPWLDPWPDGFSWAFVLTHDVETAEGCDRVEILRGAERELGYRSSWNFVPERYPVRHELMAALRAEGCEIGVHGLRHDGRDLGSAALLAERRPRMQAYAQEWGAVGFRSPATQRVWEWMPTLGFDYDSSYTDTDPYEPQAGGCCALWPFMNGQLVELPITLPQDHTLFTILNIDGAHVWLSKARALRERGGLALVLAHPDYAVDPRMAAAWRLLLEEFASDTTCWRALPYEVAEWWRQRAATMVVHSEEEEWRLIGPAAGRGRLRWATPEVPCPAAERSADVG
jgi:hypothetical protein